MNFELLKGSFTQAEAIEVIRQLVSVKIKFHEDKIDKDLSEEDIKMRENRIKKLQEGLQEAFMTISKSDKQWSIESEIKIQ